MIQKPWRYYKKIALTEMRPYIDGEDLSGVKVEGHTPGPGGMIARNPMNHEEQWYVDVEYARLNFVQVSKESQA